MLVALLPTDIDQAPKSERLDSESRATLDKELDSESRATMDRALEPESRATMDRALEPESRATVGVAVVIDTLRFTTTACQALQVGASCVHVAPTITRAQQMAKETKPRALLCGERKGHRIEGFDLGNSPVEVTRDRVDGRELIFTTTNGTLAVEAVRHIPTILLAAFVNRSVTCHYILEQTSGDVSVVCSGTSGQVTWEDVLTAGAVVDQLINSNKSVEYGNDSALLAHTAWQATLGKVGETGLRNPIDRQHDDILPELQANPPAEAVVARLLDELSRSLGGRNLIESGYQRDLQFAAQLDRLPIVARNQPGQYSCFMTPNGRTILSQTPFAN